MYKEKTDREESFDDEIKETQVSMAVALLEKRASKLNDTIDIFEDRLGSVLLEQTQKSPEVEQNDILVPLASRISNTSTYLDNVQQRLQGILNRLEL